MEKQEKVVKKIQGIAWGSGTNLGTKKDDECYTAMQDILNELSYWANLDKFRNKNIICPCDWDIVDGEEIYSITITYKEDGVEVLGNNVYKAVKSVFYDLWSDDVEPVVTRINLKEDEIEEFLRDKLTCNFIRTFVQNARAWGIKSITASGYNPANGKGTPFQEVDYSKYDICVTNPPFSLYPEFMECIVGHIDFIVLAPFMNRANPSIGLHLMLKQAYLGTSANCERGYVKLNFSNPTKANKYNTKTVACDWITSFSEAQDERDCKVYKSGIDYELYKDDYKEMPNMTMKDGTHPIKVPCNAIPDNYTGWMFTGVNVLNRLDSSYEWYGTNFAKYYNELHPEKSPFSHKVGLPMYKCANGKGAFAGVVFRKRPKGE